jgi:WD40 repeat protein
LIRSEVTQKDILSAEFSFDNESIWLILNDLKLRSFEFKSHLKDAFTVIRNLELSAPVLTVNCNGQFLALSVNSALKIWDLEFVKRSFSLDSERRVVSATFSPNKSHVVAARYGDGSISVYDRGQHRSAIFCYDYVMMAPTFSPDGNSLILNSSRNFIELWDWATVKCPSYHLGVYSAKFSPDGRLVLFVFTDGSLGAWDLDQNLIKGIETTACSDIEFSPDGKLLVTVSEGTKLVIQRVSD